jgi:sortase A
VTFQPANAQSSIPSLSGILHALQRILLLLGLVMIALYFSAKIHSLISSRLALLAFTTEHGSANSQPPAFKVGPGNGNFRLWSTQRISAYKSSLATKFEQPLAVLSISRLDMAAPIFEGTDSITLNRGLGRIRGTAMLEEAGNVGIAGHRDGFFRSLRGVVLGDAIELTTAHGRDRYIVDRISIVDPTDTDVLKSRQGPQLTLVTCYPFNFIGAAPRRYIIQASLDHRSQPLSIPPVASTQPESQKEK